MKEWKGKSRYVRVVVEPHRVQRYPLCATEIVFTLPRRHAVDAVKTLMCWMGYRVDRYSILAADEVPTRGTLRPRAQKKG